MKKLLSILLTLCLVLAVTVIPIPAIAANGEIMFDYGAYGTTGAPVSHAIGQVINYPELPTNPNGSLVWSLYNDCYEEPPTVLEDEYLQVYVVLLEGVFDFEYYSPNRYIAMAGRVAAVKDPDNAKNTVIKFDNNGIPYRSSDMDKSNSYTKSGSTYTKAETADIEAALAANPNAYSNYYHRSAADASLKQSSTSYNVMEAYNAIELGDLKASTTYRITVNYKRENLANALYVQPVTWSPTANWRTTMYPYNDARITIPTTNTPDSDYVTVSTVITTPDNLETANKSTGYGPRLRLILFTGVADANNVVYFDNIAVEEVESANLTIHYANGTQEVIAAEVGNALPTLKPNKFGENGGVWYVDAQGTTVAPATVPAGGLDVYEVVKTGVFDFNNYYRYHDYTGNSYGINNADVVNSIYADGNGNIVVDTTKYGTDYATNATAETLRKYVIAIGEAKAATKYKITVEYSYTSANADQRLVLTPLTGYGTLTSTNVNGTSLARNWGTSVELPQGTNQTVELFFTSADEFKVNGDKSESAYSKAETGEVANSFYLNVKTKEDSHADANNAVLATISKVTVVEYVDPAQSCTVTLNRGGVTEEVQVEKGKEFTLPDTEFTDTSWWSNATASASKYFVGYEGEKIVVNGDVTYYTAETYSYGQAVDQGYKAAQSVYRNWTGIDTTTEGFSYFYKSVTSDASSTWAHGSSSRLSTRLGVIKDGNTYRISVTYKATTNVPLDFVMVLTTVNNAGGSMRNYLEEEKVFHTVSENTNGWKTVTYYLTADTPHEITPTDNGLDDTKVNLNFEALYLMIDKAEGKDNVEIAIKETKIEDLGEVVEAKGASVLKDENVVDGKQAMRYYFDYKTATDGTTITVGGNEYDVVERGFIYANGDYSHYAAEGVKGSSAPADKPDLYNYIGRYFVASNATSSYGYSASFMMWLATAKKTANAGKLSYIGVSGDALLKKWNLDGNTLTFSTYIKNISEAAYNAKFMVRGYVTFEDENGVQHTIYSKTVNRSVNGIANVLNERH